MHQAHLNEWKKDFDWPLLLATVALGVVGVLFIFSATGEGAQAQPWYKQMFFLQMIWFGAGLGAAAAVCLVDYGKLARWSRVIYWGAIASLAVVLAVGKPINGSRRWVTIGGQSLQPSEFAKIAFILVMAEFLSRPEEELRQPRVFFAALGYTALPCVLILAEPNIGSALVFGCISLAMLFVAGVPNRFLRRLAGWVGPLVALAVAVIIFAPPKLQVAESYQKVVRARLTSYSGLGQSSYNVRQSLISVGSGGFLGKGWRQGTQHELGFLPKLGAHNDFIFSVIAEEEGFVGSVVILTLYSVLLFSGIKVASQARDRLGQLLAVGVVTLLFSHVFINIGMNIRLMPVTGIPLPLLSYGGSSVVCSLAAIGVLHNVHIYRKSY
ncbi:MAG: FtsW/RodA/SpoVE family cell cycle protein [Verrucomicrobiota bacterium]|jgi:rod shape determining protein RodA